MQVGDNVYYDSYVPPITDRVHIGDDCVINMCFQSLVPHVIDRGHLQFADIHIGSRCTLGVEASVQPATRIQDDAVIGPLSLVLKGEMVPEAVYAVGCPVNSGGTQPPRYYRDAPYKFEYDPQDGADEEYRPIPDQDKTHVIPGPRAVQYHNSNLQVCYSRLTSDFPFSLLPIRIRNLKQRTCPATS